MYLISLDFLWNLKIEEERTKATSNSRISYLKTLKETDCFCLFCCIFYCGLCGNQVNKDGINLLNMGHQDLGMTFNFKLKVWSFFYSFTVAFWSQTLFRLEADVGVAFWHRCPLI